MNKYVEMKKRHQKEVNNFPIKFAFSDEQFKKAMEELGLKEDDLDKVVDIGAGGFIRKADVEAYKEMGKRQYEEFWKAIREDKEGNGFIKEMFLYELANHEYVITREIDDTLEALALTRDDIKNNKNLRTGLLLAEKEYLAQRVNELIQEKNKLDSEFKEITRNKGEEESLLLASVKVGGIAVRNLQRENNNLDGEIEEYPYSTEELKMIDKFSKITKKLESLEESIEPDYTEEDEEEM